MICPPCRIQDHDGCPGGTWCDCQHVTEGENINRELVPESPVAEDLTGPER